MDLNLMDKVVVISGGTSGIGLATARLAVVEGARVFLLARHEVVEPGCEFIQCDVTEENSVQRAMERVADSSGRIDMLINSAGIYEEKPLDRVTLGDYNRMMNTNVLGTVLLCREVLPYMQSGCIINVASDAALRGNYGCALYAASKGAVVAFTKSLALDLAPAIRVNVVCPGDVATPMLERQCREGGYTPDDCAKIYPFGRVARPEEVAHVILSLASPKNGFMTGAAVEITGGL